MPHPISTNPLEELQAAASQAVQTETAPLPLRRARIRWFQAGLLAAAGVFGLLTFLALRPGVTSFDLNLTRALQSLHLPGLGGLMELVSWPGYLPQSALCAGLVILLLFFFGLRREAAVAVSAAVSSSAASELIKALIQRPRPDPALVLVFPDTRVAASFSYPSGHVLFYTVFFGFACFLAYTLLRRSWKRSLLLVLFGGLVLLVGPSRVYLGVHWSSDAAAAYLLGSLLLALNIRLYRRGKR